MRNGTISIIRGTSGDRSGISDVHITDSRDHTRKTLLFQDDHASWEKTPAKNRLEIGSVTKRVINDTAKNYRGRQSYGRIPGAIQHVLLSAKRPSVNWPQELRRFVCFGDPVDQEISFSRPNRRFRVPGMFIPGNVALPGRRLLVGLDTSGSISDTVLEKFLSEIRALYRFERDITVVQADAKIQSVSKFRPGQSYKIKGRGGTDFRPVFRYAKEHGFPTIVYLTDGLGTMPGRELARPTLWVLSEKSRRERKFPFGRVTYVEEAE